MRNIIILFLIIFLFHSCNSDNNDYFDNTPLKNVSMKPFSVPIQKELTPKEKKLEFIKKFPNGEIKMKPLYSYKIYARIYSKRFYRVGMDANPAPYDLALGWDGLEKEEVFNTIKARQSFRWVRWRLKHDCIYSVDEVYLRLANNHIVPANENILKGLQKLKKKDIVYIEGYLISYVMKNGNKTASGASSTSRTDRLANSCEVIYATRLVSKYGDYR